MTYQLDKAVAQKLKDFFEPFDFIDKVVIFGSRAKHNANPKSDIDLCIYSLEMSDAQFSKLKLSLEELPILYKIDVVHFEKSNEALRENVSRDGKLLFVKKANLGDIALFIRNGLTVQQDKSKKLGCPITRIETISHGVINFDAVGYADLDKDEYKSWLLKKGDILISHINSEKHLGKSAICTDDKAIIHGMNLLNLRVKENVFPIYLFYYLKTSTYKESIHKIMKKSVNQASFSLGGFRNIEIPLPSLTKQQQIAQTLDKASELITLRKASIEKLDELAQSIFIDMFGDPVENPRGWIKDKAEKHIQLLTGYPFKSQNYSTDENDIKLCGGLIITPHGIDWNKANHWNKNDVDQLERYWLKVDDIVMAMDRPWISSGFKIHQIRNTDPEALLVQRTARIRPIKLNCKFLYFLYKEPSFAMQSKITETTVPHISPKDIQNYNIILPPIDLQNQFAQTIEKIESQKSLYEAELTQLQAAFDALMAQSFEG